MVLVRARTKENCTSGMEEKKRNNNIACDEAKNNKKKTRWERWRVW